MTFLFYFFIQGFALVPSVMVKLGIEEYKEQATEFADPHKAYLPSPDTLQQELNMWFTKHQNSDTLVDTLEAAYVSASASVNFPNISYLTKVMLTMAVTSASTERANSTLKFIKSKLRSTISQTSLNAFILAYKHKDLLHKISSESICNSFVMMKRRRRLIHNPLSQQPLFC